eukprot:m.68411 g.68411  ORF g.68411 m.68411 type:complete len:229 (+) comp35517_c0_seq8:148-834(+)
MAEKVTVDAEKAPVDKLSAIMKKISVAPKMDRIQWIYHVTEVKHKEVIEKHDLQSPAASHRKMDAAYDGCLVNIPCKGTWFTATMYQGGRPTVSPYPANCPTEEEHHRVSIKVSPKSSTLKLEDETKWELYFVKEKKLAQCKTTQHMLAFLPVGSDHADWIQQQTQSGSMVRLNHSENNFFYFHDNSWMCSPPPIWTNIFVAIDRIELRTIPPDEKEWDTVRRKSNYF